MSVERLEMSGVDSAAYALSDGTLFLMNPEDEGLFNQYYLFSKRRQDGRVVIRAEHKIDRVQVYLHRLITDAPDGVLVDHVNRITLDNRRTNLRLCTDAQSLCNRGANRANKFQKKGVRFRRGRYQATIGVSGRSIHLGTFDSIDEAAAAYDRAAVEHHGCFARLNYPLTDAPGVAFSGSRS